MSGYGSTIFGYTLFGGEPIPYLEYQIDAETTTEARRLMARGLTDGTSLRMVEFAVGQVGYDPVDYTAALPVNPDAIALDDQVFRDDIDYIEEANDGCRSFYCLLESGDANYILGEVGIFAEVQNSPGDPVSTTQILFAIGHFPAKCKNSDMQYALRVTVQA